jgi:hypothetical protein
MSVIFFASPGVVGRAWHGPSPGERNRSELLDMQAPSWLTIAIRFGDKAGRLLDLEDSRQPTCPSSSSVRTEPSSLLLLPRP